MDKPQLCRELVEIAGMDLESGWARLRAIIEKARSQFAEVYMCVSGPKREGPRKGASKQPVEGPVSLRKARRNFEYVCKRSTELYESILLDTEKSEASKVHMILGDLGLYAGAGADTKEQETKVLKRSRNHYLQAVTLQEPQAYLKLATYAVRCGDVLGALACSLRGIMQGAQPPCIPQHVLRVAASNANTRPLAQLLQNEPIDVCGHALSSKDSWLLAVVILMLYSVDDRTKTVQGTQLISHLLNQATLQNAACGILEGQRPIFKTDSNLVMAELLGDWRPNLNDIPVTILKRIFGSPRAK